MEIYTIEGAEKRILDSELFSSLSGAERLKSLEKHHYIIHLIIKHNIVTNTLNRFVKISSERLKDVLGRNYSAIVKNLVSLKLLVINHKYSPRSFSKSYMLDEKVREAKIIRLTLKSSHMIKKLTKEQESIQKKIDNDELLSKIDRHTKNLFLFDEAVHFLPPRDEVFHSEINKGFKIRFVSHKDNPNKLFRYEEFRKGLLDLNNLSPGKNNLSLSVFYRPVISNAGRVYHMATSIPKKIRAGLRTKKMELIYEVDMASAQPSILILEWLKHLKENNLINGNKEAEKCLKLLIEGGIYNYVKDNSVHFGDLEYSDLKKAILTVLNSKDYPSIERDELIKLFPGFMSWIRKIKATKGYKEISHIGQSAEAKIFIGTYRALDSNIFALPIHDCILTTKEHIELIKDMLIAKTKELYSNDLIRQVDLSNLFRTELVSLDNNEISNKNWVKYIMDEGGDRNDYIEEYGIDYPYEPLEDILK